MFNNLREGMYFCVIFDLRLSATIIRFLGVYLDGINASLTTSATHLDARSDFRPAPHPYIPSGSPIHV